MNFRSKINIYLLLIITAVLIISFFFHFRIDLTADRRYSISEPTKKLLKKTDAPIAITIYLDGDLNPGFLRLKKSTQDLLEEMSVYSHNEIKIKFENPSIASTNAERERNYSLLAAQGMTPTSVYERDKEGKSIQKIVFPWMKMTCGNKSVVVNLLKNIKGNSGKKT